MNEENKTAIINHRIFRSKETIADARFSIDNDRLGMALNRIYYSIFYIISALAFKNDFAISKHRQLMNWFNFNFVKKDIITENLWDIYKDAYDRMLESDYQDFVELEKPFIEKEFSEMLIFVDEIEKIILT